MATRAFDRMVGELVSARRIDGSLAEALRSRVDRVDLVSVQREPCSCPDDVRLPRNKEMYRFKDEEWLGAVANALPCCLKRTADERIVIAELTTIRQWTRDAPQELRMSCWTARHWQSPSSRHPVCGFFHDNTWWRMDEYPEFAGANRIKALAVHASPVFLHVGRSDWLVPNPVPCKALGWNLAQDGNYRWSANEEIMVETLHWKDGPQDCVDLRNDDITAEGWLVVASPTAARVLMEKFPSIVRRKVLRILAAEDSEEEGERTNSARELLEPSEILGDGC